MINLNPKLFDADVEQVNINKMQKKLVISVVFGMLLLIAAGYFIKVQNQKLKPDVVETQIKNQTKPVQLEKIQIQDIILFKSDTSLNVNDLSGNSLKLQIIKNFDIPVYLKDNNSIYVFDKFSDDNQKNKCGSGLGTQSHCTIYKLPLDVSSFRVINYYFIADKNQVLYWNWWEGARDEFIPVNGIDAKTAMTFSSKPEFKDGDRSYVYSLGSISHMVVDKKEVYLKTEPLTSYHHFNFFYWKNEEKEYGSIYGASVGNDKVICLSQQFSGATVQKTTVIGHILTADSNSFRVLLIGGGNYYAKDDKGHVFVNCNELPWLDNQPIQNFDIKSLFKKGHPMQLLLTSDMAIYDKEGNILIKRVNKNDQLFNFLDDSGRYFVVDGKIYWYKTENYEKAELKLINNGDVDLDSFKVLISISDNYKYGPPGSFGVAKDKKLVFINDNITILPKDLVSFSVVDCPSKEIFFKDVYNVYGKDGVIIAGADPNTFKNDPLCKTWYGL